MNASLTIAADLTNLSAVRQFITETSEEVCPDERVLYDLSLAVDEAVTNIINHGYRGQSGSIEIILKSHADRLEVLLRDDAPSFNPLRIPKPDLDAPLDKRKSGGLGIFLARKLTDRIVYRRLPDERNELKLVKLFPLPANR